MRDTTPTECKTAPPGPGPARELENNPREPEDTWVSSVSFGGGYAMACGLSPEDVEVLIGWAGRRWPKGLIEKAVARGVAVTIKIHPLSQLEKYGVIREEAP